PQGRTGSGGGGSSHVDAARVTDARFLAGEGRRAPGRNDPFWRASADPVTLGTAEGGQVSGNGGDGRVVLQWTARDLAELRQVSGLGQVHPSDFAPMAVLALDADGRPVRDVSVTFAIEDPHGTDALFHPSGGDEKTFVASTDARGRAQSPPVTAWREGDFSVRVTARGVSTVFRATVRNSPYTVTAAAGDDQRAGQNRAFGTALEAAVVRSGAPAPAGTEVEFRVEDTGKDSPRFGGRDRVVTVRTDAAGRATAPTLVAGRGTGTYTVAASVEGVSARFAVEVVPGKGSGDDGQGAGPDDGKDTGEGDGTAPDGTTPDGGRGADDGRDTGPGASGGTSGTTTGSGGGSLALTGATGTTTLIALAALLAAGGWAAVRYAGRLTPRRPRG
ncbi:hypothetical protein G3I20_25450, partial [Streptomyces sp. SID8111]|nr:hypothetical protein [Streptomyces sp. SID8111]